MNGEAFRKHSFPPAAKGNPVFLILGSLPGEESLRQAQYYAHPRNAFWDIMEEIWGIPRAMDYPERLAELNAKGVALWDVVASGTRRGSLDSGIREELPNDIAALAASCPSLRRIGCNGVTSHRLLLRNFPELAERIPVVRLPSTSPAAAMLRFEQKLAAYRDFFFSAT